MFVKGATTASLILGYSLDPESESQSKFLLENPFKSLRLVSYTYKIYFLLQISEDCRLLPKVNTTKEIRKKILKKTHLNDYLAVFDCKPNAFPFSSERT